MQHVIDGRKSHEKPARAPFEGAPELHPGSPPRRGTGTVMPAALKRSMPATRIKLLETCSTKCLPHIPENYPRRTRRMSQRCPTALPTASQALFREPGFGPNSAKSGRCRPCLGQEVGKFSQHLTNIEQICRCGQPWASSGHDWRNCGRNVGPSWPDSPEFGPTPAPEHKL